MEQLAEDSFQTFIPRKQEEAQSIDLQKMMLTIVQQHHFTIKEFWEMPLNLLELLGMFTSPEKKSMSRKRLIEHERQWNRRMNGY